MTGKVKRVPLREVWRHEAIDFSRYLQENLDLINEVTNLDLVSAEREQSVGVFSVDLLAEDRDGGTVVIENQLERSDHDHLGKVITYLAALGAKAAVWVVPQARPEHIAAMTWLAESTAADFYLIKAEAIRVVTEAEESQPAPMLTLLVGPSAEAKKIGNTRMGLAGRGAERHEFWTLLLERAKGKTKLHSGISPSKDSWIGTPASPGKSFLTLNYVIGLDWGRVELYIDREMSSEDNKAIFDQLLAKKEEIERVAGSNLDWQRLEGKRACRIAWRLLGGGYRNPKEEWPEIQDRMIDAMVRLERALAPQLRSLVVGPVPAEEGANKLAPMGTGEPPPAGPPEPT
jgi:hypothetical protein